MNFRLGIVLSAIFLVFACGMITPAQASPLRFGAGSACASVPARHNRHSFWTKAETEITVIFTLSEHDKAKESHK